MTAEYKEIIKKHKSDLTTAINNLDEESIIKASNILVHAAKNRLPVFTAGNGACSSLSEHWACDHLKGSSTDYFNNNVISLSSNMALVTAIGNDISFDEIFSFQLKRNTPKGSGGVVVLLSASGSSKNIIKAAEFIRNERSNMKIISITGFMGEPLRSLSDVNIHVYLNQYEAVEDAQQTVMHILAKCVKKTLLEMREYNASTIDR